MVVDKSFPEDLLVYDDKTLFLLRIIHKYLKNENLRNLLPNNLDNLLSKCMKVINPGMRLICRLYWRKRSWYRRNDIMKIASGDKSDMSDPHLQLMINSLLEIGLIETSVNDDRHNCMTFDDLVDSLKLCELKEVCIDLLKLKVKTKTDAIQSLKDFSSRTVNITNYIGGMKSNNANRAMKMLSLKTGTCYRLSEIADVTLTNLYYLMYLGLNYDIIRENKLELLLINSKANKETFPIDKTLVLDNASVVFDTKDEFKSYTDACTIFENWETAKITAEKLKIVTNVFDLYKKLGDDEWNRYKALPLWLRRFTPAHIYIKILESSVPELKKLKEKTYITQALDVLNTLLTQSVFRQHKKAEWYTEKALILQKHEGCINEAVEVLLEGLESDVSEESKDVMRHRASKIAKLKCTGLSANQQLLLDVLVFDGVTRENNFDARHIYKQPRENFNNRGKIKFQSFTATGELVVQDAEYFCIEDYINSGQYNHGGHWEGRIVTTIFFLLFWDIIYARLPGVRGVFLTPYQKYPQDLFTESFYVNRKTLIDDRLQVIQNSSEEDILKRLQETWDSRPDYEVSGIHWEIEWVNVAAVCTCLGASATAAICRRLALDYRYSHSGFPDLTMWNTATKKIKFVEVKTDSDKASLKQLQWMQFLRGCGVPVEFCYVGVNTTRCKARSMARD